MADAKAWLAWSMFRRTHLPLGWAPADAAWTHVVDDVSRALWEGDSDVEAAVCRMNEVLSGADIDRPAWLGGTEWRAEVWAWCDGAWSNLLAALERWRAALSTSSNTTPTEDSSTSSDASPTEASSTSSNTTPTEASSTSSEVTPTEASSTSSEPVQETWDAATWVTDWVSTHVERADPSAYVMLPALFQAMNRDLPHPDGALGVDAAFASAWRGVQHPDAPEVDSGRAYGLRRL